jgi:hypothetical protein
MVGKIRRRISSFDLPLLPSTDSLADTLVRKYGKNYPSAVGSSRD